MVVKPDIPTSGTGKFKDFFQKKPLQAYNNKVRCLARLCLFTKLSLL